MKLAHKKEKDILESKRFWLSNLSIILSIVIAGATAAQQGLQQEWTATLIILSIATAMLTQVNNFISDEEK